jgi:hypothetical protein
VALQLLLVSTVATTAAARHTKVVVDFVSNKNGFYLSREDLATLNEQNSYHHQEVAGNCGVGIVVQNIQVPPETVWKTLVDFETYPKRISKVTSMKPYQPTAEDGDRHSTPIVFQEMTIVFRWIFSYSLHIRHKVLPEKRLLSWTLDPSKDSSVLTECSGYWQVHAHPSRPEWSQVIYRTQITMGGDIPPFIQRFVRKQGLQEATDWLRIYSELDSVKEPTTRKPIAPPAESAKSENHRIMVIGDIESQLQPPEEPLGISRYLLVSTVWGLGLFNTYLYFSHYR